MQSNTGEQRVAELLAGLRRQFIQELPERCDQLEQQVMALEGGFEQAAFDDLFRRVHSLKGTGGTHGLPVVTGLCHQFENLLTGWQSATDEAAVVEAALRYIDLLRRVPEAEPGELDAELDALLQGRRGSAPHLLLVDASRLSASLCRAAFEPFNVELTVLEDGLMALQELLHVPYDAVIVGGELPGINGLSVVAALRYSSSRNSRIPVVLVTSRDTPLPEPLAISARLPRDHTLVEALQATLQSILKRG